MLRNVAPSVDNLAEGPSWDAKRGRIYWVDIPARRYHYMDLESRKISTVATKDIITSLYPDGNGGFMGTTNDSFIKMDPESNSISKIASIDIPTGKVRFNDGKCDSYGNYWAGTMDIKGKERIGKLYSLNSNGKISILLEDLTISNGLCWDTDRKLFYHVDTPTRKVSVYDYSPGTMEIWNRRTAVDFGNLEGNPDGMAIDSQGKLWVAHWGGSCISKWDPQTGKLVKSVEIPAKNVTSCAFGGFEMDRLFITTARNSVENHRGDMGGSLFELDESF